MVWQCLNTIYTTEVGLGRLCGDEKRREVAGQSMHIERHKIKGHLRDNKKN